MNKTRFAKPVAVVAGFILLCGAPEMARALRVQPRTVQTPNASSPGAQPNRNSPPPDDFAGLNYTDEQRAEIAKIHQETESRKATVAKDDKLNEDQKNAMLVGYTRMEYGWKFKVLTPEQRRQVRAKMLARRAEDEAALKKQPPPK